MNVVMTSLAGRPVKIRARNAALLARPPEKSSSFPNFFRPARSEIAGKILQAFIMEQVNQHSGQLLPNPTPPPQAEKWGP